MSLNYKRVKSLINEIEDKKSIEAYAKQVLPLSDDEIAALDHSGFDKKSDLEGQEKRIKFLEDKGICIDHVTSKKLFSDPESLKGNIENYIGMAQIPIGLAGPLLVNGTNASGDFYIPLATTEGALVASYNRGMRACRLSGGITSIRLGEGVQRSPFFKFENILIVGLFIRWLHEQADVFNEIIAKTSRHAQLVEFKTNVEANGVILTFEYTSGDASGQNMVTICTNNICKYILETFEYQPTEWYVESNYSGDKKATSVSFSHLRGRKVTAEVVLKREIVEKILKTTPEKIIKYWQTSTLAVIQSGSIGAQGHIANGLTALFIACGQDVACISESSIGLTRMEIRPDGNLYASTTLPSLMVGTVGGGTGLPTQSESLKMIDCYGKDKARKFSEICCAVSLAGEVSIASAMTAHHFSDAHRKLGRKK